VSVQIKKETKKLTDPSTSSEKISSVAAKTTQALAADLVVP